jgi:hypothetical protein
MTQPAMARETGESPGHGPFVQVVAAVVVAGVVSSLKTLRTGCLKS